MKRTPVLIDVNGVPLRESLSYNGCLLYTSSLRQQAGTDKHIQGAETDKS